MTRLADYIKAAPEDIPPAPPEGGDVPVEEVFTFPDHPQPTVATTVGRMVRAVIVPGEPSADEMEAMSEVELASEPPDIRSAFDRGARLSMPKPKDEPVDPNLRQPKRKRSNPGGRAAGSDEFTDLFAAGMIMLISFTIGNEFQPTEDEARDLARPIGNILARRIDLAKKLGQDANDVVAFAVALMAYMVRVGPVATDRVREQYRDRQQRTRLDRIAEPAHRAGEDSVPAGPTVGAGTPYDPARRPIDAIAEARDAQLRAVDRDFGYPTNGRAALAD